ncbi:MAG: hypothetical protein COV74_01280 [Candidatus Omnitrophica bacterium CG11_big_fil_rev_8_21_14_0_20_45_26]|uniref:Uncharacterized protein n=1 Tax=Candidatus Abzuiibacterium crystallinum TaxID=1974748 RepID=A0A2H0LRY9_9BACT|nr:MAG: hypothetical protein COV74_01280 [Candidatus Omnitrophica bacterium CG11_big_fil_rev_8_21_14_0_20_45_26]PIW64802.1 MAG: hypothetical protein COW12_04690 [Candidatus Omnitrophica bacterium CG12_big_fil_rev_8_21_14_0_65_45_16]
MQKRIQRIFWTCVASGFLLTLQAGILYAGDSEEDLRVFLESLGDFLIQTIGPGVLVIGVAIAGVSMALGDEQGMRRGALAAGGGALIMLARAILDLIQNLTGF